MGEFKSFKWKKQGCTKSTIKTPKKLRYCSYDTICYSMCLRTFFVGIIEKSFIMLKSLKVYINFNYFGNKAKETGHALNIFFSNYAPGKNNIARATLRKVTCYPKNRKVGAKHYTPRVICCKYAGSPLPGRNQLSGISIHKFFNRRINLFIFCPLSRDKKTFLKMSWRLLGLLSSGSRRIPGQFGGKNASGDWIPLSCRVSPLNSQ